MSEPRNLILRALPDERRNAVIRDAELVDLPKKKLLYDVNKPIDDVYFIETGVASIVSVLKDLSAVETATCGREGLVGLPVFFGAESSATQGMQQIPGTAYRLAADAFLNHLDESPDLRRIVGRFAQATMTLIAQNSACNRRHSIEERCARWLLTSYDQMDGQPFELTHQFLSQMLGVRRATVTVTAGGLQQAGLITYHRGVITVLNPEGLREMCCECYAIIHNEYARLLGGDFLDNPYANKRMAEGDISIVGDGA
jgi:CRP-like cAMP-binding protein